MKSAIHIKAGCDDTYNLFRGAMHFELFKKPVALLLAFLFAIQPVGFALAQEMPSGVTSLSVETSAQETPVSSIDESVLELLEESSVELVDPLVEDSLVDSESEATLEQESAEEEVELVEEINEDLPQSESLSEDEEATVDTALFSSRARLSTRDQSGAYQYSYQIKIPPGRNGLQPDLQLNYSSRDAEVNNIFGYGWSINIPYIQRLNREGIEEMYTGSYFVSTLDGELATTSVATTTLFAPVVENGSFNKYSLTNNVWTVTDKKGTRYIFGTTTASRQDNPGDSSKVYTWFLEEVRDTNNNFIRYEYDKDSGQVYPSQIVYTGNNTTDGIFTVDFNRTSRTDTATSSAPGFNVISKFRVNEIEVKIDGTLTREYQLTHTAGDSGSRLLLTAVTETGYSESGTSSTLPDTTFQYQRPSMQSWTTSATSTNAIPEYVVYHKYDEGVRFGDVNGDGLVDMVRSSYHTYEGTYQSVYLNNTNGTGWQSSSISVPSGLYFSYNRADHGSILIDINGDGYDDIIRGFKEESSTSTAAYINNNGTGWTLNASTSIPVAFAEYFRGRDLGVRFGDVNGDGLVDLIQSGSEGGVSYSSVYINQGDMRGWIHDAGYSIPVSFSLSGKDQGVKLADVNNDGFVDIVWAVKQSNGSDVTEVYINKGDGTGWTQDSRYVIPVLFANIQSEIYDRGVRFSDVNGDNLPDLIQLFANHTLSGLAGVYLNKGDGTGWVEDSDYNDPTYINPQDGSLSIQDFSNDQGYDVGTRLLDLNGDGMPDLMRSHLTYGAAYSIKFIHLYDDLPADRLTRVVLPEGGALSVVYKNSTQYEESSAPINPNLPYVLSTVSEVGVNDGFGNVGTTTYSYGGGLSYFNGSYDRKFAGFATTTETDAAGNVTKKYLHQGNSSNSSIGEYDDHVSKIGKIYRTEKYDGSSNLYSTTVNQWDKYNQAAKRDFVKLARKTELTYDGDGDHKDTAEEYEYNNTYGNLGTTTKWGEVTASDDGTFSDTGTDKAVETNLFVSNTGNYVVGLPYLTTLVNQSSAKVREHRTYYDTLSLGSVGAGNPTKVEQWKSSSNYVSTQRGYDSTYGLATSTTDARGKVTSYEYDTHNLYPATTTNALSQSAKYEYDYSLGKVATTTDSNGFVFATVFDGLDRPLLEKQPDLTSTSTLVTKRTFAYTDTSGSKSVLKTDYLNSGTSTLTYQYFDGLGRLIQERQEAETSNEFNVKDVVYNTLGLTSKESLRYASSGTPRTSPTETQSLYTNYSYDPLRRISTAANAVGTTTYAYDDWKTTVTDANGDSKYLYKDAYDNLNKVEEVNSGNTYTTLYEWDLNKQLTKITDALSNIRNFTYDGLGRRLTAEDLHASGDGTYGTWTYAYDDSGNLTQRVDPKSQTVNFTYDDINRQLTEDYTGQAGTEITYTYDSCMAGIGRLCMASTTDVITSYGYNTNGGIRTETRTIGGQSYTTQYDYDRQGNPTRIIYPDGGDVRYGYNAAGQLETVARKESTDSVYLNAVSNFDYSPMGQVKVTQLGNNASTTNTYDTGALYRLSNKTTRLADNTKVQDLSYTYDAVGNITQIVDNSDTATKKTINYTYDDLSRLLTATTSGATSTPGFNYSYTYNALGNLLTGPLGTYSYDGHTSSYYANPHAPTSIATSTGSASAIVHATTTTDITTGYKAGPVTRTWNHTATGTDPLIVVAADIWQDVAGVGTITSITWNGGAFTLASSSSMGTKLAQLWYLVATTTGEKSLSITVTGATDALKYGASTFQGVNPDSPLDAVSTAIGSTGNPSANITTGVSDALVVTTLHRHSTTAATTNRTALYNDSVTSTLGASSYQIATSTASYSDTYTGSASHNWAMVMASFKPSGASSLTTLSYDNNGNLTSDGSSTHVWNYRNELVKTTNGASESIYLYDHEGKRVKLVEGANTTIYPNKLYSVSTSTNATSTKSIFAGDLLLSTVEGVGSSGVSTSTPAVIASVAAGGTDSSVTTASIDTTGADFLLMAVSYATGGTPSISDSKGNTWTPLTTSSVSGLQAMRLYYTENPTVGSGHTFSNTGSYNYSSMCVVAASGVGSGSFDTENGATNTSSTIQTGSVTPAVNGELLITGLAWNGSRSNYPPNLNSSFTVATSSNFLSGNHYGCSIGYYVQPTAGAVNPTWDQGSSQSNSVRIATFKPATTTTSVASTTVRYIHTDHLGSTQVVSDESGTAVTQVLDYYPYGEKRLESGTDVSQREYIGEHFDDLSNLSYLNARYMDSSRGQFLSQDPVFLAIGNPNQVKQLSQQEQRRVLYDPQLLNSYNYGRNNPLRYKDPDGKYVELSGSVVIPGRSFAAGLRFDSNGIDYFMAGGVGYGAGGGIELAWAPGVELSHRREASVSGYAQYAEGVGGRVTQNLYTYDPETRKQIANGDPVGAVMIGAGGGGGVQYELSSPIPGLVWGSSSPRPGSLTPSTLNNQTYISRPTQTYQSQAPSYIGSGGGSLSQTLSNLYSALSKLGSALSSYVKSSN